MNNNLNIKVWDNFNSELFSEWNKLTLSYKHEFFQNYVWQKIWFEEIIKKDDNKSVMIIGVYFVNKIIAILPFEKKKFLNLNILSLTGFPFADYFDFLLDKEFLKSNPNLKKELLILIRNFKNIDLLRFNNFTNKSNCYFLLNESNLKIKFYKSYQIEFNKNNNIFENKKFLADTNRQQKRLNLLGKLSFSIAETIIEKKKVFDFFKIQKKKQLILSKNWNYFENKTYENFLERVLTSKFSHVSYLSLNHKIIAAHMGFNFKKKLLYLFPTYDTSYKIYSPGNILIYKLSQSFFKSGGEIFDLTIGDETYKKRISNSLTEVYFKDFTLSYKGKLILVLFILIDKLKQNKIIYNMYKFIRY